MKRLALAAVTALTLVGPLAAPAAAQQYGRSDSRDDDRRGDNRRDDDRRDDDRRGDNDRRGGYDRNDDRRDGRDHRRSSRWDNQRHNGYSYNGRWYYGPPPGGYEDRRGYEAGYRQWRRGERLPSYYQNRYRNVDYRRAGYRAPPRGYRYVQDDRGDMLLVGIATGVILSVILANH